MHGISQFNYINFIYKKYQFKKVEISTSSIDIRSNESLIYRVVMFLFNNVNYDNSFFFKVDLSSFFINAYYLKHTLNFLLIFTL